VTHQKWLSANTFRAQRCASTYNGTGSALPRKPNGGRHEKARAEEKKMQWALDSGYYIGTSEIGATFSRRVKVLEDEIPLAVASLQRSPAFEVNPYWRKLDDILKRAQATGDGNLVPYAQEIDRVWQQLNSTVLLQQGPRILHAFHSGLQLGWAYMRCAARVVHGNDTPKNLEAAKLNLDAVKNAQLPGFTYDYESRIEDIKREYNAGSLATAADLIEDLLRNRIKVQFPPP
jgi:hypothetical protein